MTNLEHQKQLVIESFVEFIHSLSEMELYNFIVDYPETIKSHFEEHTKNKNFIIKEGLFGCEICSKRFGECDEENNNECSERFLRYCKEK